MDNQNELPEGDDVRANAVEAAEEADAQTPTPTQAELDALKRGDHHPVRDAKTGHYKTRQSRAG